MDPTDEETESQKQLDGNGKATMEDFRCRHNGPGSFKLDYVVGLGALASEDTGFFREKEAHIYSLSTN